MTKKNLLRALFVKWLAESEKTSSAKDVTAALLFSYLDRLNKKHP